MCETVYDQNNGSLRVLDGDTSSKKGGKCEVHSDCESGICKTIYDKEGQVEMGYRILRRRPDNSFIFKDADTSKADIKNEYMIV